MRKMQQPMIHNEHLDIEMNKVFLNHWAFMTHNRAAARHGANKGPPLSSTLGSQGIS
jgi:hypothetical protein